MIHDYLNVKSLKRNLTDAVILTFFISRILIIAFYFHSSDCCFLLDWLCNDNKQISRLRELIAGINLETPCFSVNYMLPALEWDLNNLYIICFPRSSDKEYCIFTGSWQWRTKCSCHTALPLLLIVNNTFNLTYR